MYERRNVFPFFLGSALSNACNNLRVEIRRWDNVCVHIDDTCDLILYQGQGQSQHSGHYTGHYMENCKTLHFSHFVYTVFLLNANCMIGFHIWLVSKEFNSQIF